VEILLESALLHFFTRRRRDSLLVRKKLGGGRQFGRVCREESEYIDSMNAGPEKFQVGRAVSVEHHFFNGWIMLALDIRFNIFHFSRFQSAYLIKDNVDWWLDLSIEGHTRYNFKYRSRSNK
jgi:hypothetical protein